MEEKMQINKEITVQQMELAKHIQRFCKEDGTHITDIPSLHFIRASHTSKPIHVLHEPALCIVAQGKKIVMLAQDSYTYDSTQYLVVSLSLPISGEIIQASPENPYLCLRLDFKPEQIFDIMKESNQTIKEKRDSQRGLYVSQMKTSLMDAVLRLVRLLDTPNDIPILAPLVIREILYRILQEEQANSIKKIAMIGSHTQRIAKVINLIKRDFTKPLRIDDLASFANMSPSTLHQHFKQVTRLSPLQYQKQLRLQEARRLMLSSDLDAADAGFQVGYESPTQFNREYSRLFGFPPKSDIKRFREA